MALEHLSVADINDLYRTQDWLCYTGMIRMFCYVWFPSGGGGSFNEAGSGVTMCVLIGDPFAP